MKVVRGDIYKFFTEDVNLIIYDIKKTSEGNFIEPVDVHKYKDNLEEISIWAMRKAYSQKVVWYIKFSGTETEIMDDIDTFCNKFIKHQSKISNSSNKGQLTIMLANSDYYILDTLKSKIIAI